jgi:uncharacterized protein
MIRPMVPFRQFVLKVHSRCDLSCDHCYIYHHADQRWRGQPKVMSGRTIAAAARRIAEHARAHRLEGVLVVLHGGEPLLAGLTGLRQIGETLRASLDGVCGLDLRIHTNGVLLDDATCELFRSQSIKVGISLDGDRVANDRHRRYADGRSSYHQAVRAIERLNDARYQHLYAGLLCTIDVDNDPISVYESLVSFSPPQIDFLLPHATWDKPPPRPQDAATIYSDWLTAIFSRWNADGRLTRIRLFESIIRTTLGHSSLTESLGLGPTDRGVVETDGANEQADSLKASFNGAPATGFNVFEHSLDRVAGHPGIVARQLGLEGLCDTCRACPVVTSCGGGLYAHRYRSGSGYGNPSVYCADLKALITHIRARQVPVVAGRANNELRHVIPYADFDALAAGHGGSKALTHILTAQRSLRRGLIAAVHETANANMSTGQAAIDLASAWAQLTRIDRIDRVAVDSVLGHPYVRVWAARCIGRLSANAADRVAGKRSLDPGPGHLGALVVAAAVRSRNDATVVVPVLDGAVHFPTLGRLMVGGLAGNAVVEVAQGTVSVKTQEGSWTLTPASRSEDEISQPIRGRAVWQPVRYLTAQGMSVALEDTDPYRDCHKWPAVERVDRDDLRRWRGLFRDAWRLIGDHHETYASGLAAGLSTIMPLQAPSAGNSRSAAARHAVGAVGAAMPPDSTTLALLLIHEFQHVKLGAVLDLVDLYDQEDARLFHAPWRTDPRPLEGLLQGAYAHVAVTDFWWRQKHWQRGPAAAAAGATFATCRDRTTQAIETLARSGSLTPLGRRFLDGMQAARNRWLTEPEPPCAEPVQRAPEEGSSQPGRRLEPEHPAVPLDNAVLEDHA